MKLELARRTLTLASPLRSAHGEVSERELVLVQVTAADGTIGYGEAAPMESYDGVSLAVVQRALEGYVAVLAGADAMNGAQIVDACRRVADLPQALAAIDMALWDITGKLWGVPVYRLLGGPCRDRIRMYPTPKAQKV
ncbi:MAG TPA: hypothetical protein VN892_07465, partial [Solirubrobacteraceae bacterium]|nr:hypothetical protein [Solirubrobacteraceae bacterium]